LGFDPYNHFMKIREFTETPIPKVSAPLGVWGVIPSHFATLSGTRDVIPGLPFWLAPLQALALVASSKLGLQHLVSQPHYGQVWGWSPTLPKLGIWSPSGLSNVQSSTARPKTPRIDVLLVSLERSWNVDIENGLALVIWTSAAHVIGKRRAGSQTASLTPDH
jgi:hypothetical protein